MMVLTTTNRPQFGSGNTPVGPKNNVCGSGC
jgi:hypothetical protein